MIKVDYNDVWGIKFEDFVFVTAEVDGGIETVGDMFTNLATKGLVIAGYAVPLVVWHNGPEPGCIECRDELYLMMFGTTQDLVPAVMQAIQRHEYEDNTNDENPIFALPTIMTSPAVPAWTFAVINDSTSHGSELDYIHESADY